MGRVSAWLQRLQRTRWLLIFPPHLGQRRELTWRVNLVRGRVFMADLEKWGKAVDFHPSLPTKGKMDNWDECDTRPAPQRGNWSTVGQGSPDPAPVRQGRPTVGRLGEVRRPSPSGQDWQSSHPPDSVVGFMIHTTYFPSRTTIRLAASRYIYICSNDRVAANLIHGLIPDSRRFPLDSRLQPVPIPTLTRTRQRGTFPDLPRWPIRVSGSSRGLPCVLSNCFMYIVPQTSPNSKKVQNILGGHF